MEGVVDIIRVMGTAAVNTEALLFGTVAAESASTTPPEREDIGAHHQMWQYNATSAWVTAHGRSFETAPLV